jgi:uncharacterized protein YjbI with pentapeptide repeats
MFEIQTTTNKIFKLEKTFNYSTKSLQRHIFNDIDIKKSDNISFHRVDFKGSSILNSNFNGVDFSRSDFISMNFENSRFNDSSFENATFLNNIFYKIRFEENNMTSLDLLRSSFIECSFVNQIFSGSNWTNLIFDNCEFNAFKIEKSTLQNINFKNCNLKDLDLARLTAINLTFENCTLDNVIFDPDNLGSYCFDKKSLGNISYLYKEAIFKFDIKNIDNIRDYSNFLLSSQRYAEFFGFSAILAMKKMDIENNRLIDIWINCLKKAILEIKNEYVLSDNIEILSKHLKFYIEKELFSVLDIIKVIKEIELIKQEDILPSVEELFFYISTYLKEYIEKGKYSYEEINLSNNNELIYAKITLETDSFLEAEKIINRLFRNLLTKEENSYFIVNTQKGSIILTIITTLASILTISKLILSIQKTAYSLILNHKKFNNSLLIEEKKKKLIQNLHLKKKYSLKDLIKENPKLIESNKQDLMSISELEIYIN